MSSTNRTEFCFLERDVSCGRNDTSTGRCRPLPISTTPSAVKSKKTSFQAPACKSREASGSCPLCWPRERACCRIIPNGPGQRDLGGVAVKECSILERTALVRSLKPYASNLDKRLTKSPKRYFIQNCGKNWKIHLGRTREGEEIGFLIVTDSGDTIALDARMNLCRRHRRPRLPESFKRLFPHVSQIVLVTFGRTSNPTVPRMPGGPCRRTARFSGRTDRDRRTSSREEVKRDVWACGFFLGLTRGRCFIPISSGNKKCGIARDSAGEKKVLSGLIGEGGLLVREIFVLSSSNG